MAERYVPARPLGGGFKENEDGSLDVKVLVLSGEEMYRDEQGDFVIDLETVALHKPTLIMDYNHDESEVIGHISNLRYEEGGLWGDAHLFSARAGDRAEEVILRILGGTPYEISPTVMFSDSNGVVIDEGFSDEVNGRTVEGPATIFVNTPIRGVSICPYGTDKFTGITTLKMDKPGDKTMAESKTKDALAHPDLEEMISEFGESDGLKYYRAGLSIDEARAEDYALLKAERAARLATLSEGGGGEGGDGGEGEGEGSGSGEGEGSGGTGGGSEPASTEGEGSGEGSGGEGGGGGSEPQPGGSEPASTEGEGEPEATPEGAKTKKKKKEEEGDGELRAKLSAELKQLRAEITSLKAALRRGEDNPLGGGGKPKAEDKRPNIFKQADVLRAKGIM